MNGVKKLKHYFHKIRELPLKTTGYVKKTYENMRLYHFL